MSSEHKNCRSPLHVCVECGAWWLHWPDGTWSLLSGYSEKCCNNAPMGAQVKSMDVDQVCQSVAEMARCLDGGVDCAAERVLLRKVLIEATDFIDNHSEIWSKSGQDLLAKCRAALSFTPSGGAES